MLFSILLLSLLPVTQSQTSTTPSSGGEYVMSENCDPGSWDTFLQSGRDGQPTNGELLQTFSVGCRGDIKQLTQGYFGPATHYERFITGCKGICQQWDALQSQGRSQSRCTCEDLDTCDQNAFFWMCKTLYECRTADEHRNDFCNGCGTGQRDEFDFYEELDCGSAANHRLYIPVMIGLIILTTLLFWSEKWKKTWTKLCVQ